jgi:hypothetical protein
VVFSAHPRAQPGSHRPVCWIFYLHGGLSAHPRAQPGSHRQVCWIFYLEGGFLSAPALAAARGRATGGNGPDPLTSRSSSRREGPGGARRRGRSGRLPRGGSGPGRCRAEHPGPGPATGGSGPNPLPAEVRPAGEAPDRGARRRARSGQRPAEHPGLGPAPEHPGRGVRRRGSEPGRIPPTIRASARGGASGRERPPEDPSRGAGPEDPHPHPLQRIRATSLRCPPRTALEPPERRAARGHGRWVRSGPGRRARPPMDRAPAGRNSGSACRAMDRRETGLGAWRDRTVAPRAHRPSQPAAVRMPRTGGARGRRFGRVRGGCLTQRGEFEGRVDGPAHQGAQGGAPLGSAGGQWGEHVFGRVGGGSDGRGRGERAPRPRFGSGARFGSGRAAMDLAIHARGPFRRPRAPVG